VNSTPNGYLDRTNENHTHTHKAHQHHHCLYKVESQNHLKKPQQLQRDVPIPSKETFKKKFSFFSISKSQRGLF